MKKIKLKFEQHSISLGDKNSENYLIVVETLNDQPLYTYLVCMHNFKFYDEKFSYYVINDN